MEPTIIGSIYLSKEQIIKLAELREKHQSSYASLFLPRRGAPLEVEFFFPHRYLITLKGEVFEAGV